MDRTERFYRINHLLSVRQCVPLETFLKDMEVSRATFKRDLEYLRERLHAPIIWDAERHGYRYDMDGKKETRYQLPGIWFTAQEIHALLVMEQLLRKLQPRLLTPYVQPLLTQIRSLIQKGDHATQEVLKRIRVLPMGSRPLEPLHFEVLCSALLSRKRLQITHYHRGKNERTERVVSPQRLVYYRDNWYLDTWCHWRRDLRTFAADAIESAELMKQPAREISEGKLDEVLAESYGIFMGKPKFTARLRFSPRRARWVAREQWHPAQKGGYDEQGNYLLEVPYADERELIMDILRYGSEVEVTGPVSLRNRVKTMINHMQRIYT
jgi:predicted DNA-binding transcriptional regulator YafY